jgi:hypothetical protein
MNVGTKLGWEFRGFHGGDVSSRGLLCCDAVQCCGRIPSFQRSMLSPSSPHHSIKWHHHTENLDLIDWVGLG